LCSAWKCGARILCVRPRNTARFAVNCCDRLDVNAATHYADVHPGVRPTPGGAVNGSWGNEKRPKLRAQFSRLKPMTSTTGNADQQKTDAWQRRLEASGGQGLNAVRDPCCGNPAEQCKFFAARERKPLHACISVPFAPGHHGLCRHPTSTSDAIVRLLMSATP
jgi:hypothetical protein